MQALIGMANVLLSEGRSEDVVTLCKRTLSLDDRNTQAYSLLGEVYTDQHQPSNALPFLEKAVEIQPKLTQNRVNLARMPGRCEAVGSRAHATLEEIVRDHPRFPGVQFNLGVLYEEQGQPDEARGRLRSRNRELSAELQSALQSRETPGASRATGRDRPIRCAR